MLHLPALLCRKLGSMVVLALFALLLPNAHSALFGDHLEVPHLYSNLKNWLFQLQPVVHLQLLLLAIKKARVKYWQFPPLVLLYIFLSCILAVLHSQCLLYWHMHYKSFAFEQNLKEAGSSSLALVLISILGWSKCS